MAYFDTRTFGQVDISIPEWPIYQASGYGEVFMYDHNQTLRWIPNYTTLKEYGYEGIPRKIVSISWFYDKPIGPSIKDALTGRIYPPEQTPNYSSYRGKITIPTPAPAPVPPSEIPTPGEIPVTQPIPKLTDLPSTGTITAPTDHNNSPN